MAIRPEFVFCALLTAAPLMIATVAHAEGELEGETAAKPAPKKARPKPKVKAAPKTAAAPTTPAAPIPYNSYGSPALSPEMNAALTPGAARDAHPTVENPAQGMALKPGHTAPPPPVITQTVPIAPVPLPPPVAYAPAKPAAQPTVPPSSPPASHSQVTLKCETQVLRGARFVSQGTFYIDLFPSAVFPDEHADFKFLFVDPAHQSLIRSSVCLDTGCSANVTGSAYYLVNRVTKRGSALRITLDRSNGAFYAEEIENNRVSRDTHLGEKGYCVPQKLPNALF